MIRRYTKVEYAPGSFVDLPAFRSTHETEQELETAFEALTGADYDYDELSLNQTPKRNAIERVQFLVVEDTPGLVNAKLSELRSRLRGRVKLWTSGSELDEYDDESAVDRWAYARMLSMPRVTLQAENRRHAPVMMVFSRMSDWYAEDAIEDSEAIAIDPDSFSILNPGDARVFNPVITLSGTYTNPRLTNGANGYVLESTRDGSSANHLLRFTVARRLVEFSSDNGATWVNDAANFVRQSGQVQPMVLESGANAFTITGMSSGTVTVDFFPAYS